MKFNNKNQFIYYGDILSKLDIITIGLYIVKYEQKQITYKELRDVLKSKNIELQPYLHDISTRLMTLYQYETLKTKLENEEYEPNHLNGFIISSSNYKNVLIKYDRLMIRTLAEYGDKYSKAALDRIIEWQESISAKFR